MYVTFLERYELSDIAEDMILVYQVIPPVDFFVMKKVNRHAIMCGAHFGQNKRFIYQWFRACMYF